MKKYTIILVVFLVCAASLPAQNINTVIKTEALKMAKALTAMDMEAYSKFMYPSLMNESSSKERLKQGIDSIAKYREQFGIKVKQVIIGNPSPVLTYKNVMQCTIPQTTTVESMMGSIEMESIFVALSNDGKTWYFVESNLFRQKDTKDKLPELSPNLVLPTPKQPVMKPADQQKKN
jgi:hypothetical protein